MTLTVSVYMVKKYYTFDEKLKGSNDIPRKLIECGVLFDANPGDDISVMVAPKKTKEQKSVPLILMRLHTSLASQYFNLCGKDLQKLYERITLKHLSHGGFDIQRRGGSSGTTSVDRNFLKFIRYNGNFPRKGCGIKFIQHPLYWICFYISPKTNNAVHMRYGTPVTGGSIRLTHELANSNPIFQQTATAKKLALELIKQLNEEGYNICLQAYDNEYNLFMSQTTTGLHGGKQDNNDELMIALSKQYRYTMLEHCVGYHCDKNTCCLEVRRVFLNKHKSPTMGRGGFGINKFGFGLLAW